METRQQYTNTIESVKKNIDKYISKKSVDLLNYYRFDRPNKLDIPKYLIIDAMSTILCAGLDCNLEITDEMLEKINLYVEKQG
jgi:hypothetical protein